MSLTDVIDRLMGTTPKPVDPAPSNSPEIQNALAQVDRMQRDFRRLDVAVSVAEDRLRARGWTPSRAKEHQS